MIGSIEIQLLEFDRGDLKQNNLLIKFEISNKKFYSSVFGSSTKLTETFCCQISGENEMKITIFDKSGDDYRCVSHVFIPLFPLFDETVWGKSTCKFNFLDKWFKIQHCKIKMKITMLFKEEISIKDTPISSSPIENSLLTNHPNSLKNIKEVKESGKFEDSPPLKKIETPPPTLKKPGKSLYDPPLPPVPLKNVKSQSFALPHKPDIAPKDETVVIISESGDKYVGKVKNKLKNGKGEIHYSTGSKYYGEWKNDKMEGFGVFVCEEYTYHGSWINGEKEGSGILIYGDGTIFEGIFKKGEKNGEGKLMMANGDSISGIWNNENVQGTFRKGSIYDSTKCGTVLLKERLNRLSDHSLTFGQTRSQDLIINKWETMFKNHKKTLKDIGKKCEISIIDIKHTIVNNKKDAKESLFYLVDKLFM